MSYVTFQDVCKYYHMGSQTIAAADHITFSIGQGEFCIIVGPSGAGKTTVLNILGGMDSCDEGTVLLDDRIVSNMNEKALTAYRRHDVGFVFQFYNLVQNLTALENVELASEICSAPLPPEEQRVAIARALAKNPKILLCDEPTGALDYSTGKTILKLLQDCCRNMNKTVIVVTHNQALTPMADRVIHIHSGKVSRTEENNHPIPVEQIEW